MQPSLIVTNLASQTPGWPHRQWPEFLSIFRSLGFFERVSTALNVVTPERCRVYFRSVRRYLTLYANGMQGKDIPEAMSLMRKHRKHRAGTMLSDEAESQRGKNSHKRTRIENLKAMNDQ